MRKIKFRAWDKDNQTMRYGNDLQGLVFFATDGMDTIGTSHTLQQFTGLYDSNKKPIYEGDIVKYMMPTPLYNPTSYYPIISDVISDQENACFKTNKSSNITSSHEVIGNIYENPELLEKEVS